MMEGTSGAADRVPLRGGACEAALSMEPRPQGSGLREAEIAKAIRSQARSCQEAPEGALRDAGYSSLRSPRAATGGVRAEWVGAKLPRERSRREVPSRGKLTSAEPLAHDISTGRVSRKGDVAIRSSGPRSKGRGHETGCTGGRPLVRSCGVQSSVVVLAGRIDCRSRQAARGPSRPKAKSFRTTMNGSSPSARERRRGERASEAGSSVAKPRDRWRVPTKPVGSRERIDLGASVEGRRFGSGKSSALTSGRRKRSWLLESVRGSTLREATGRDRERQRSDVSLAHGRKSHAEVAPPGGGARICRRRKANRDVYGSAEAGGAPSSARPAGVGLSQGGPASHGRTRPLTGKGKHPANSAAQAARPEIERSTGARVDSRLQRSERGIFSAPSRGAARQTEVARSSTMRRRVSTGRARTHRAKRVRGLSRERDRERGRLRSIARSRSNRRKAPWAHGWRCL
jgi:hypothetical protein